MKIVREEVKKDIPEARGLFDLMDMVFLPAFNITAKEMDYMADKMSTEEVNIMLDAIPEEGTASFSNRRKALELINKYLIIYQDEQ